MEHLIEFAIFFGKAIVIIVGVLAIVAFIFAQAARANHMPAQLEVERPDKELESRKNLLKSQFMNKKEKKKLSKKVKKEKKSDASKGKCLYVIDFEGDIKASAVKNLREEISTVINVADSDDEVLVRVESPGGVVHGYGLAAAQLDRIKNAKIPLTVAVDKVAASGGYMMACTADKIIGSPFAILGSIGVLAQVPNLHRLLKDNKVDYQEISAGEYKRTLTIFGEITEKGKQKFVEQMEDTHVLFKEFVKEHRPQVDIDKVATGEYWFGKRAKELNLLDEIITSDDYMMKASDDYEIVKIALKDKKKLGEKIAENLSMSAQLAFEKVLTSAQSLRF